MSTSVATAIDPVRYEMYIHRLVTIAEEGRIALQKVTASPIVVQGGECMSAFYGPDGTAIHTASGHLRFSAGCEDAVKAIIREYSDNPGINEGDQFFLNDPYIASTHVYDETVVKPIFYEDRLVAWTASMTHTADTGGMLRGGATEIFHEGVRSSGIKLVESDVLRKDVFRILTEQCRDPQYVGLDLKSRIAANNVCSRGFHRLIEKYGINFINAANAKLIADSEAMARARLRSLPDGIWRSLLYNTVTNIRDGSPKINRVVCAMTKKGDQISFDFTGSSEQSDDTGNMTLVAAWGQLFVALSSQLFWNIPWNGGMARPVTMIIPEGTFLNCRYPAACGNAPAVGMTMTSAASECISKMLFAAGLDDDVNASYYGSGAVGGSANTGGPGFLYGGHNQHGLPVGQGIYDMHGSGFGAAPYRDGVSTGGHQNNPSVGISDIENIEVQYPFLYISRKHMTDSGGFGKFRGGLGMQRLVMVYGTDDLNVNYSPYHGIPGGWGLFGGYPMGAGGSKFVIADDAVMDHFADSTRSCEYADVLSWGEIVAPDLPPLQRLKIPDGAMMIDPVEAGSGYGDPLDRDPTLVARDVAEAAVSVAMAAKMYGVVVNGRQPVVDIAATERRRAAIREERLAGARAIDGDTPPQARVDRSGKRVALPHEYVELARLSGGEFVHRCTKCAHVYGPAAENYKLGALHGMTSPGDVSGWTLPDGSPYLAELHEYFCPSCATLVCVEVHCPTIEGQYEPIWDCDLAIAHENVRENVPA